MKILEKIKKIFLGIGVFLVTLPMKVWAVTSKDLGSQVLYGLPEPEPRVSILENIEKVINIIIMPLIILMIGTVIYIINGKSSKLKIFLAILLVVGIIILLCLKIIEMKYT